MMKTKKTFILLYNKKLNDENYGSICYICRKIDNLSGSAAAFILYIFSTKKIQIFVILEYLSIFAQKIP